MAASLAATVAHDLGCGQSAGAIAILSPCGVANHYSLPILSAVDAAPKLGLPE